MREFILLGLGSRGMRGGNRSLLGAVAVGALLSLLPVERGQAQLLIDVYESRDDANSTLWVFSGSSTTAQLWSVRTGVAGNDNFARRDSWEVSENSGGLYIANAPSNERIALSPVTGLDAITSRDRWYVANVLTNITGAVGAPTLSITTNSVARSSAITSLFLNDDPGSGATDRDELGIRVSGGAFRYDASGTSAWSGAGILAKPFSDFYSGAADGMFTFNNLATGATGGPRFAAGTDGSVQVRFHRGTLIPEPQEYALVFGLLALGFVMARRHWQTKRPAAASVA